MKKISIIILDFLKSKRVVQNVELLLEQVTDFDVEIIIIDNSCNKKNKEKLMELANISKIHLIFNEKNLGYTKAYNKAAKNANGEIILMLNPDILMTDPLSLQKIVDYMRKNPSIAILGPKQTDDNGSRTITMRAFPKFYLQVARRTSLRKIPFFKSRIEFDEMRHLDPDKTHEVDWLQSSCLAVRKDFWNQVGGLNEQYFLFMSDPDICFKAWELKKKVVYFPKVNVRADGIRCSEGGLKDFFIKWTIRQHVLDSLRYKINHFLKRNPRLK